MLTEWPPACLERFVSDQPNFNTSFAVKQWLEFCVLLTLLLLAYKMAFLPEFFYIIYNTTCSTQAVVADHFSIALFSALDMLSCHMRF